MWQPGLITSGALRQSTTRFLKEQFSQHFNSKSAPRLFSRTLWKRTVKDWSWSELCLAVWPQQQGGRWLHRPGEASLVRLKVDMGQTFTGYREWAETLTDSPIRLESLKPQEQRELCTECWLRGHLPNSQGEVGLSKEGVIWIIQSEMKDTIYPKRLRDTRKFKEFVRPSRTRSLEW